MKRAFTLIELLVVIAIIAVLSAILFPVFARAKESAKKAASIAQMRQLSAAVMMYASDVDDYFPGASMRTLNPSDTPVIWTELLDDYVRDYDILVAPGSNGCAAYDWNSRRHQSIGYNDATGIDPSSTAEEGKAGPGTEGFACAASFSQADESAKTGLFAVTANGPRGDVTSKHRGYVFNPYNGMDSPDGDYKKGLPMISDRDLVTETGDENYPNSPDRTAGMLKPIYARYFKDKKNGGSTPVVFADGHTKCFTARQLNVFGAVIWRFR